MYWQLQPPHTTLRSNRTETYGTGGGEGARQGRRTISEGERLVVGEEGRGGEGMIWEWEGMPGAKW